jgi:hypothetical protein
MEAVIPRPAVTAAAAAVVLAATLVACSSAQPAPTSSAVSSPNLTPVPGGSAAASPGPALSPATQTDTEWGRIWDALPPSFPLPPDAVATQTGEEGPVSGSYAVGASAQNAAGLFQTALTGAGFSIEGVEGPMEDDSMTVNAVGPDPACLVQVRARPLSGTTNVVVLYGAACPFE